MWYDRANYENTKRLEICWGDTIYSCFMPTWILSNSFGNTHCIVTSVSSVNLYSTRLLKHTDYTQPDRLRLFPDQSYPDDVLHVW